MAAMNVLVIMRKILRKFKTDELRDVLKVWNFLPLEVIESKINLKSVRLKEDAIWKITQLCLARQVSADDVANLDLHYISRHSSTEKWTVFEMRRTELAKKKNPELVIPNSFLDEFYNCMDNFGDVNVKMMTENGRSWLRIYFHADSGVYLKTNTVYLCHYARTNFFTVSRMKLLHKDAIVSALKVALHLTDVTALKLTGKDIDSLFQLAVNRNNQELGHLWSTKIGQNPLLRAKKRKREEESEPEDERIRCAELPVKRQRQQILVDLYGTDQLPTLNRIEYKLDTSFRGRCVPEMVGKPFACTVKFEGKSVLEGVRDLVSMGIMNAKMPGHVKHLPFMASNHVSLKNR